MYKKMGCSAQKVAHEQLFDFTAEVLTASVESGSGYWALISRVRRNTNRTIIAARFVDAEQTNAVPFEVDGAGIERGIARILTPSFQINPALRRLIAGAVAEFDSGNIDAEAADVIVQDAVFGEIVYG